MPPARRSYRTALSFCELTLIFEMFVRARMSLHSDSQGLSGFVIPCGFHSSPRILKPCYSAIFGQ